MVKYSDEQRNLINSRFEVNGGTNICVDCRHVFKVSHYDRKLSHLRNCERKSDASLAVMSIIEESVRKQKESGLAASTVSNLPSLPISNLMMKQQEMNIPDIISFNNVNPLPTGPPAVKRARTSKPKTDEKTITSTNKALAQFFQAHNLPFDIVESPSFKDLITQLNSAYSAQMPSQEMLASLVLSNVLSDHSPTTTSVPSTDNSVTEGTGKQLAMVHVLEPQGNVGATNGIGIDQQHQKFQQRVGYNSNSTSNNSISSAMFMSVAPAAVAFRS